MTLTLPAEPGISAGTPRPIDGGSWQTPIAGGTSVRIERPNACHMAVDFTTPRIPLRGLARIWVSRLLRGIRQPVQVPYPQPEITIGTPGATIVDGGGQGGYAIAIKNGAPGYVILEGQALNLYDAIGRAYIHICSADTAIGGNGKAAVPVEPMVRCAPADGSQVNLTAPVIEGKMTGNDKGVTLKRALASGLSFTIEELR